MTTTASAVTAGPSPTRRAGNKTRRRFLILSVAALAVLATALGISFTADTGVSTITASAASTGSLVYSAGSYDGSSVTLPSTDGTVTWLKGGAQIPTAPVFNTIVAGTPTSVKTQGDVAVVNADTGTGITASNVLVTIYVTNMQNLAATYSSYALPVQIYGDTVATGKFSAWNTASPLESGTYLTNTSGYETFTLPTGAGKYYEITLDSGGSLYPFSTSGDLAPSFYITAQQD